MGSGVKIMSYNVRWRKAIAVSVFLHMFIGMAVGYMTVRQTLQPPTDEQVMELDLTAFPGDEPSSPEPQIALPNAPALEIPPQEEPPLTEPAPVVKDDSAVSELVPIKALLTQSDTTTAPVVVGSKNSGKGTPPVVLMRAEPINPPEVDQIGRKIIVVLRMQIMKTGLPGKVEVAIPSGQKSINDAAIAAAKKWRFEPAKDREGNPVVCSTILSIPFTPQ